MENKDNFNEIAYKKAQKRVKEIKIYWWMVLGYLLVGTLILYRKYDGNILDISTYYKVWMVMLWGIFLLCYGIYLFVPGLHNWEERKIKKLMDKQLKNK